MLRIVSIVLLGALCVAGSAPGATLYVSKQGDDSDGSSWAKAFHSIQKALDAVPDAKGGHRIVVRPDRYVEANLYPAQPGAAGAYNELIGDYDGQLGSGATGWAIIDSGDPEKGFKSYDWWSTIKATQQGWSKEHTEPTFSSTVWDRWKLSRLYSTGSDAGLFWDGVGKLIPFTIVVEDSVGIGRAFGGGVGGCLSRPEEPSAFRRCWLWSLDWWGDTAGAYVRIENEKMPDRPDILFEDSALVSPQCSLKAGNPGFATFTRVGVKGCRLVTLNFSQPVGTPTKGIVQSVIEGRFLHVDFEDTTLMGYKVFGVREKEDTAKDIGYTTHGATQAYVQFEQEVPKGFHRLGGWPVGVFQSILPPDPTAPVMTSAACKVPSERAGAMIYVSKLGDDSDGTSWAKGFHTIQKALDALPDGGGGHRILIRPDTYMEAMLRPKHAGAKDAYNVLDADYDGSAGSGATGYCVLDSGDATKGLKAVDWWGPFFCTAKESAKEWDRWAVRHLYSTGSEGGIGWDMSADLGASFSVIAEDCFGIGRAFGGIVGGFTPRADEPCVFRRCQLWSLDWWGDTSGMYVRAENKNPTGKPDVYLEDCTLVSPQCALKVGNPGFDGYTHVGLKNCRLITLNFSQPVGTPTDGIVQSVVDGKFLRVDFDHCDLMGYKVFGVRQKKETEKDIRFTAANTRAYVQFQQAVPEEMQRENLWPIDVFPAMLPPFPPDKHVAMQTEGPILRDMCEVSPVLWKDRLCLMACQRPASGGTAKDYYIKLNDVATGEERARFGEGYSLASAMVHDNTFYAFASRFENDNWNDVAVLRSADLKTWETSVAITQDPTEHLFNSSVCPCPDGFVMAYETNDPKYPAFTVKFATSPDAIHWTKQTDAIFGTDRYTACPCIRYVDGWYYLLYLEHRTPRWRFDTYIARSKDLRTWTLSPQNPVLVPEAIDDGINASDPDVLECNGKTYLYYAVGDQLTWMNIKRKVYDGPMGAFLAAWFPPAK